MRDHPVRTEADSQTTIGRPVVVVARSACPKCSHRNPPDRQFCAQCGARLSESCIACGAGTAVDEKFCGACGVDLVRAVEERTAFSQGELERAVTLRQEFRYEEAIGALAAVAAITDHRLEQFRPLATQLIAEIDAERQQWLARRDHALQWAKDRFDRHEFDEAATSLEELPDWLRTESIRDLLLRTRERQAEIAVLSSGIRQAVSEKKWDGLLPRVQRLLELQPRNEQAQRLAEKLKAHARKVLEAQRQRLCEAADRELERHNYAGMAKLLAKIDESVRTPEIGALLDDSAEKAEELAWLKEDLYYAVEYDDHLLPVAKRLLKLAPNDQAANKIAAQLLERERKLASDPRPQPVHGVTLPWMKAGRKPGRPYPVECFRAWNQIVVQGDAAQAALTDPESFLVAMGVALQGLGKGPAEINLVPSDGQGVFGRFRQAIQKRTSKVVWGIDLGRRALKAVKLAIGPDERPVIEEAQCIEHDTLLNQPDAKPAEILGHTLDALLSHHELEGTPICLSMPSSTVFARYLMLPDVDGKRLDKVIRYEAQQQLPVAIDETTWGFQVLSRQEDTSALMQQIEVAIFALKTEFAKEYLAPWQERNLKVDVLQSDTAALYNFFAVDVFGHGAETTAAGGNKKLAPTIAILDVGTEVSNLLVTNGTSLWTRNLSVGGNQFTRAIARDLEIPFAEAEQLKRYPTKTPRLGRLYQSMQPVFQDLLDELQRSLDHYAGLEDRRMFQKLLVMGGGLRLHGLLKRLRAG